MQTYPKQGIPWQQIRLQGRVLWRRHCLVPRIHIIHNLLDVKTYQNRTNNLDMDEWFTSMLRGSTGSCNESLRRNHPPNPETRTCFRVEQMIYLSGQTIYIHKYSLDAQQILLLFVKTNLLNGKLTCENCYR